MGLLSDGLAADQTVDQPTRTGKSYLIRALARESARSGTKALIVSHRAHILSEHAKNLEQSGVGVERVDLTKPLQDGVVGIMSAQAISRSGSIEDAVVDEADVVLIDEAHKALGEKTVEGLRSLYPNAVRIVFTATPDYADNRSVTDEYGSKIVSHSIVEAIEKRMVPPVRAFLYKTDGQIDLLDPNVRDFTPRELKRLANFTSRNRAIVNAAEDLISDGRQGLITTIPGEDLAHAELLKSQLSARTIVQADGTRRQIVAEIIMGGDDNAPKILEAYENVDIDVLLYCDVLKEKAILPKLLHS